MIPLPSSGPWDEKDLIGNPPLPMFVKAVGPAGRGLDCCRHGRNQWGRRPLVARLPAVRTALPAPAPAVPKGAGEFAPAKLWLGRWSIGMDAVRRRPITKVFGAAFASWAAAGQPYEQRRVSIARNPVLGSGLFGCRSILGWLLVSSETFLPDVGQRSRAATPGDDRRAWGY